MFTIMRRSRSDVYNNEGSHSDVYNNEEEL